MDENKQCCDLCWVKADVSDGWAIECGNPRCLCHHQEKQEVNWKSAKASGPYTKGKPHDYSSPQPLVESWEQRFGDYFEAVFTSCCLDCPDRDFHRSQLMDFIRLTRKEAREEELEWVKQYLFDNHDHHEFADEDVPKPYEGCHQKDYPYVNSMKMEEGVNVRLSALQESK